MAYQPPVIIIGMHRSGTSLITDVLEKLGLYMGKRKDSNQEAFYFLEMNQWLLQQSGASWYDVAPFEDLLNHLYVFQDVVAYLRFHAQTPHIIRYLGWLRYLAYRSLFHLPMLWGWKDPRNTFTLPIWREVFPNAKVIHIYRNGVDVAQSLVQRSQKNHERSIKTLRRWRDIDGKLAYGLFAIKPPFALHQMTLESAFALWEAYIARADRHIQLLSPEQAMTVRYETCLKDPVSICVQLCDFLAIETSREHILEVTTHINVKRANAYQQDSELMAFYEKVQSTSYMQKFGYS